MSAPIPFDEVELLDERGRSRMSAAAFFELPLSERIRHVIARTAVFLQQGREVDRHAALAMMRLARAS